MKVILQQDVRGQGKKGQLVEISDGYARNFLLPRKLAVPATAENINTMKLQEKARQAQMAAEKAEAQALAEKLQGIQVKLAAKAGEGGRLFGAVTSKEIAEALSAQFGLNITKTVSEKRLKESVRACVDRVAQDCAVIGQQEHAAEIMAEYRVNGFDCVGAMNTVASRLRRERECRMRQEEQAEQEQQEQERQAEMLQEELVSFAPPQVCETPIDEVQETVENDPYKTLAFTVRGRLSDLRKLKQFLVSVPYDIF